MNRFNTIILNKPKILKTGNRKIDTIVNGALNKNPLKRITIPEILIILESN